MLGAVGVQLLGLGIALSPLPSSGGKPRAAIDPANIVATPYGFDVFPTGVSPASFWLAQGKNNTLLLR